MPGSGRVLKCVLSTAALFVSATAAAQESDSDPLQFSITPFAGYSVGGNFRLNDTGQKVPLADHGSFALAVDMRADQGSEYEVFYSRQSTELRAVSPAIVEYLHFGGILLFGDQDWIKPYFGAGIGLTRLSPGLAQGREDSRFSASLALGLNAPVSHHFALRFETRGFFTPIGTDTALFCRSDQGGALCQVRVRGSLFSQGNVLAGATYAF
jgi:opacity protein-like surface antigen